MAARVFTIRTIISLLMLAWCLAGPTAQAGDEVLDLFVGHWDVRAKTLQPVEIEFAYRETYEWVLGHHFVRGETAGMPDGTKNVSYGTYNRQLDRYPFWVFSSSGIWFSLSGTPSELPAGTWDAGARALTWKSPPVADISYEMRVVFADEHTRRWTFVVKHLAGTVLRQEGVATRRDEAKGAPEASPPVLTAPSPRTHEPAPVSKTRITELTPQMLSILLLLVIAVAPVLTLILSALLLWRYRHSVIRQMAARGGFDAPTADGQARAQKLDGDDPGAESNGRVLYRRAMLGPWREAVRYTVAGLALALVFAVAARFVYPLRLDFYGLLIGVMIYAWPIVPGLILIVPATWRLRSAFVAAYFAVFLLVILSAGGNAELVRATQFDGIELPAYSSAAPVGALGLWLVVNGLPTLAILLFFNKWARPVAPLVLGFVTSVVCGATVAYLGLFSPFGFEAAVGAAVFLNLHPGWLVGGTVLLSSAVLGMTGWALARGISQAYRRGNVSDQSLMLDALWLSFASYYAMWLIFGGLPWAATALIAFLVYKVALMLIRWITVYPSKITRDLTFLRVFSLGRRSDRLLNRVARYWRHIGNVQIITGPDVARSTVHPHQFLDFLSGKLATHFVRDAASLERSVAESNRSADLDGRFSMSNFFCSADSWQRLLPQLLQKDDVVLMDLRSFSAENAGCIHELNYLIGTLPLDRFVLVVDDTTNSSFLERTLREAWTALPPDSPNANRSPDEVHLHRYDSETRAVRLLVRRLCGSRSR